ncbi:MAG: EAL domain-containing protein [Desulfobulbaceae bacterium]|nr:MAG: EAL domain-containing protein [Desulfobulbaceae bacterium]
MNKTSLLNSLERDQSNLSSVLAENLYQILEKKQIIMGMTIDWLEGYHTHFFAASEQLIRNESAYNRVAIFDESGENIYQSSPGSIESRDPETLSKAVQKVLSDEKPLYVHNYFKSSHVPWQIPVLFPIQNDETLVGVLHLEIDVGHLLDLLQGIIIGATGNITISDNNGRTLGSFESGGFVINSSFGNRVLQNYLTNESGTVVVSPYGSGDRLVVYAKVKSYPFYVQVSQEIDDFLSEFYDYKKKLLITLALLTLFCLAGLIYLWKQIEKKQEYLSELSVSHQRNSELITRLEQEHEASTKAATVDALTGLHNRRLFLFQAEKKLASAMRNNATYAILFIDLDRFKMVNDTLGHHVGDLLLQEVAGRLSRSIRKADIAARFGGDEFVILLSEMSDEQNIVPIVEKIISSIMQPCENLDGHQINTSPSIGIAVYPRDGTDIETLLLNADSAMYKSKKLGRGTYSFFDMSLNSVSLQEFELEQHLPMAIEQDEFVIHYQPKIRLSDFRMTGMEALVRWDHPAHQLIYPGDFIDLAERTGLIISLGDLVVKKVCSQLAQWQKMGMDLVPVAINVSPLQLRQKGFAEKILSFIKYVKLSAQMIEIEITESAVIEERETVLKNLTVLSENGVMISIDDFGKGFSSLDNIRSLPINNVKIDRSFIKDIRSSFSDNSIVYSMISLSQKLNMQVIAEGVETNEQLRSLKVAGCDYVQGYYFSRPVPEEVMRGFLISPIRSGVK